MEQVRIAVSSKSNRALSALFLVGSGKLVVLGAGLGLGLGLAIGGGWQ